MINTAAKLRKKTQSTLKASAFSDAVGRLSGDFIRKSDAKP